MALHDADVHHIKAADASPTLPDPTTVAGRTLDLTNPTASAAVWGSTGATPFQVDGVNVATLSVARGASVRVQSDGTHWVLIRPTGSRPSWAGSQVTGSNGQATFTFPAGLFTVAPVVSATAQPGALGTNGHFCEVLSVSATSCTVQGWQGRGVLVGGQTTDLSGAGVTIHLVATPAGAAS